MSRNHEVILERCKALLIKSVPQLTPVTKFDNLDNTQHSGKDDKSNKLKTCKSKNSVDWDINHKEASDGDTGISCKECGKLYMDPTKVFACVVISI